MCAGMGPFVHSKHIRAAFLSLIDYGCGKAMKLELTCTATVQSFHRPQATPPAQRFTSQSRTLRHVHQQHKYHLQSNTTAHNKTSTRVSNAAINFAASSTVNPALMQIISPANMHAFDNDHDYCTLTPSEHCLQADTLTHLSEEQATQIEPDTRGQAVVALWHAGRTKRMTACLTVWQNLQINKENRCR